MINDEEWENEVLIDPNRALELLEWAWGIIANAGEGDWSRESLEWQEAARDWRDAYHSTLPTP